MNYYGLFRATGHGKIKTQELVYCVDAPSYHEALYRLAPVQNYLWLHDSPDWRLVQIENAEFPGRLADNMPGGVLDGFYYEARHDYQQMIIEGTRLLGLKNDGRTGGYGSYIRVLDTGETCYACANGKFFDHEDTQQLIKKTEAGYLLGHHPTDAFQWHPVLFPYVVKDGKSCIDFAHFIRSNLTLAFPIQFWGHESYDRQIAWIMEREGVS